MDWIEEIVERLKHHLKNVSLAKSLSYYLIIAMMGVLGLSLFTRNVTYSWLEVLQKRVLTESYTNIGGFIILKQEGLFKGIISILSFLYKNGFVIYTIGAVIIIARVFYLQKIMPAISAVSESMNYIAIGDYGHEISYYGEDEMGKLCADFEKMRKTLIEGKKRQWDAQAEQREINAAFAHDIRTPLTVIKGYTEFLEKYVPKGKVTEEMLIEKLKVMKFQEERLLQFSKTMTTIQNMEEWVLACEWKKYEGFVKQLEVCINGIKENTNIQISIDVKKLSGEVFVDIILIIEVLENLLSNATRFAKSMVKITIERKDSLLCIYVKDDGKGFGLSALKNATNSYFTEEENSEIHFGIGLSISKMLCERHGGYLSYVNSLDGGAIVSANFKIAIR